MTRLDCRGPASKSACDARQEGFLDFNVLTSCLSLVCWVWVLLGFFFYFLYEALLLAQFLATLHYTTTVAMATKGEAANRAAAALAGAAAASRVRGCMGAWVRGCRGVRAHGCTGA